MTTEKMTVTDEKPIPANDIEYAPPADAPVTVVVLRQPVLSREQETVVVDGAITKTRLSRNGHVRTKEPLQRREEKLVRLARTRATLSWGGTEPLVETAQFSLQNTRCVGNADWILSPESVKELRALARVHCPKPPKGPAATETVTETVTETE